MAATNITPQLDQLDKELDELEDLLKPILKIAETSTQLPLLDKAKLHVLGAYAIESLLFCKSPHSPP